MPHRYRAANPEEPENDGAAKPYTPTVGLPWHQSKTLWDVEFRELSEVSRLSDQAKKDAMDRLLREGAANYLDALYALHRFKQTVTDTAIVVWKERLPDLVSVLGIYQRRALL